MKCLPAAVCGLLLVGCHAMFADDSPEAIFAVMSPAEVRTYERDTLRRVADLALFVKHGDRIDAHEGRVQLSAWLSDDDGKTWQGGLVLDERKGISYPDGFQAPGRYDLHLLRPQP